jgi:hypothetical protein
MARLPPPERRPPMTPSETRAPHGPPGADEGPAPPLGSWGRLHAAVIAAALAVMAALAAFSRWPF